MRKQAYLVDFNLHKDEWGTTFYLQRLIRSYIVRNQDTNLPSFIVLWVIVSVRLILTLYKLIAQMHKG